MTANSTDRPAEAVPQIPARPRTLEAHELGFVRRPRVPWLAPFLLLSTGLRTLLALLLGAYLDKREMQSGLGDMEPHPHASGDELWLDYVSDLGDGFDATYSVAYLLARPSIAIDGVELPRGEILVMGGDEVYPTPSSRGYEDRCKGPYQAALPAPPQTGTRPTLFAVPGNHDWYDGLTAFLRLFARRRDAEIGGWRTEQRRSYFAIRLPRDWWLFGLDEQAGSYIDDPQLQYFEAVAQALRPEDKIIIAVPVPSWVAGHDDPNAYDAVDYFIRTVIGPRKAQVRLLLSGDLHHYARYSGADRQLVTCGGGGAYLTATHKLPDEITVPPECSLSRKSSRGRPYRLTSRYPDVPASWGYTWGILWRLLRRNPGFSVMIGILHTLLLLTMSGAVSREGGPVHLLSIPLGIVVVITILGAALFARPPGAAASGHAKHWLFGIGHGLAHLGLAAAGTWFWLGLPIADWPAQLPTVAVVYGPLMGVIATELVAVYLLVAAACGVNVNELFAGQGIDDAKTFLRMHITPDGALTLYPIAVDRICRRWRANPHGPVDSPWIMPEDQLSPRLIEGPITIR